MNARRLATVLLLLLGPTWFTLAWAIDAPSPTEVQQVAPPKQPTRSLAETAPRPDPVMPPEPAAIDSALRKGVDFLLANQNKNGSWGTATLRGGVPIYAPIPGAHQAFHTAVTALCVSALIETGGESDRADVKKAIDRGEVWLMAELPKLRRATPDALYNIWSHIYGIQAFVRMHQRQPDPDRRTKLAELIREQINFLVRYESVDSGWGYYDFRVGSQRPATDSTSFMTAAGLVALREAKDIGIEVPEKLIRGAVDSLHRQRNPDYSYLYGEYLKYEPAMPINRPGGSLGRSQACNLALRLWGDTTVTDAIMKAWLDRLFARNGWLDMGRKKPIPHESFFQVAGYFYYFGHYYAGLCISHLPPQDRAFYQDHLATLLVRLQSKDGSWWDYPLYNYHQQYGTAFALMSLKCCRRQSVVTR